MHCDLLENSSIGLHRDWPVIRLQEPDPAILEVFNQFLILLYAHISGPHYLRAVDVGPVIHPLLEDFVVGPVVNEHQMFSRFVLKLLKDLRAVEIMEVHGIPGVDKGRSEGDMKQWGGCS